MSKKKVSADALAETIEEELARYAWITVDAAKEVVTKSGKYAVKEVQNNIAAAGIGGKKYRKSWKATISLDKPTVRYVTVYSTQYQIAHLLENGHVITNQTGDVYGKTRARPHVGPAEQAAEAYFIQQMNKAVKESKA